MPRFLLWTLVLLLLSTNCRRPARNNAARNQPPPVVIVASVKRMTVPAYREFVGRTDANRTVNIQPQVSGILEQAFFAEGEPVKAGEMLFLIDPSQYRAALHSAEAQLAKTEADVEQAKAQLGKARQDVARYQPLADQRAIPQEDVENAIASSKVGEAQVQQALSSVRAAHAAVAQAKLNLGYTEIRSPISGIIGNREVDPGNLVSPQTLLVTISNADPIHVHYDLSEVDYLRFAQRTGGPRPDGMPRVDVVHHLMLPDGKAYPYRGRLYMVGRAVTEQTGTLPLTAEFPNPANLLRPGQFVRLRVTAGGVPDAVLVPQAAVQQLLGTTSALVVDQNNRVVQRTLTMAGVHENYRIVTGGLAEGERVIVEGHQKVKPGMKVRPQQKKEDA